MGLVYVAGNLNYISDKGVFSDAVWISLSKVLIVGSYMG